MLYYVCVDMWTSLVDIFILFRNALGFDLSKARGSWLKMFGPGFDLNVVYYVCVDMCTSSVDIFILFGNALGFDPLGTERVLVEDAWTRFELDCGVLCMCTYMD